MDGSDSTWTHGADQGWSSGKEMVIPVNAYKERLLCTHHLSQWPLVESTIPVTQGDWKLPWLWYPYVHQQQLSLTSSRTKVCTEWCRSTWRWHCYLCEVYKRYIFQSCGNFLWFTFLTLTDLMVVGWVTSALRSLSLNTAGVSMGPWF